MCARSGGTPEPLGSDLPCGGPESLGPFQSGMVPPVTPSVRTHTHTNKPVMLSREETVLKPQEGREYLVFKSMFNVLRVS